MSLVNGKSLMLCTDAKDDEEHDVDDELAERRLHVQLPISLHIFRLTRRPQCCNQTSTAMLIVVDLTHHNSLSDLGYFTAVSPPY